MQTKRISLDTCPQCTDYLVVDKKYIYHRCQGLFKEKLYKINYNIKIVSYVHDFCSDMPGKFPEEYLEEKPADLPSSRAVIRQPDICTVQMNFLFSSRCRQSVDTLHVCDLSVLHGKAPQGMPGEAMLGEVISSADAGHIIWRSPADEIFRIDVADSEGHNGIRFS